MTERRALHCATICLTSNVCTAFEFDEAEKICRLGRKGMTKSSNSSSFSSQITVMKGKALRKTAFAKIFAFLSFGNVRFSKIRVGMSCSSFFQTCPDSRKLVPTLIFAKNRKNCEKTWKTSRNEPFNEIFESNEKMTFNSSRLDSRKLVPTRKPTWNFEFKFGMQDPNERYLKAWLVMPKLHLFTF